MQAVEVFLSSNLNLPLGPVWRGKVRVAWELDGRARGAPEKAKTAAVHRWIEEASRAAGLLIGNNDNVR